MIGVGRSLNKLARDVETLFYKDADLNGAGVSQHCINHYLGLIAQDALNTSTMFANHAELSGESEALTVARRDLMDARDARNIQEIFRAYQNVSKAAESFIDSAGRADLSDREIDALNAFQSTLRGATTAIQNNGYNNKAVNFMEGSFFIVYLLKPFVFVTSPQVFG